MCNTMNNTTVCKYMCNAMYSTIFQGSTSCITAWKHANKKSSLDRMLFASLSASASHESNVACRFFLIPGGDSKVAFNDCCKRMEGKLYTYIETQLVDDVKLTVGILGPSHTHTFTYPYLHKYIHTMTTLSYLTIQTYTHNIYNHTYTYVPIMRLGSQPQPEICMRLQRR